MPKLIFSGVAEQDMALAAAGIVRETAKLLRCPEEWITVELIPAKFFSGSGEAPHCPMVDIFWFQRPRETMEQVAGAIAAELSAHGYPRVILQFLDTVRENYFDIHT